MVEKVVTVLENMKPSKEELWRFISFSTFTLWQADGQILLFLPYGHYFFFPPSVVLPIFSPIDLKLGHLLFCYVIKCWSPIYVGINPSVLSFWKFLATKKKISNNKLLNFTIVFYSPVLCNEYLNEIK